MKTRHLAFTTIAPLLALFAAPASSQISLDMSGALIGESAVFTLGGSAPPGELVILTFSQSTGPLPVSAVLPGEPGQWDQDISMFSFPAYFQVAPVTNPLANVDLSFLSPALVGLHVFAQAWTAPGPTSFLDLKSNVVTVIFGMHGASTPTLNPPINPHAYYSHVPLASGNVLVAGGGNGIGGAGTGVAEVYDRKTCDFFPTLNVPLARAGGVAALLNNGMVLLAGGIDSTTTVTGSCELYDPATNTFSPTGSLGTPRVLSAAAKLNDGRVLVCGGSTSVSGADPVSQLLALVASATATVEIYDPATGTWSGAAGMSGGARTGHVASILPDGRVLVAGGVAPGTFGIPSFLTSAARYNPTLNNWTATPNMGGAGRALSSVAVLNDGRVMVSGGLNANILALSASALADVSLYNSTTNTWANAAPMGTARYAHTLTTLPDGRIVAAGGNTGSVSTTTSPVVIDTVEAYNSGPNTWGGLPSMTEVRSAQGASLLPDGKRILFVGGANLGGAITPGTAELYVP